MNGVSLVICCHNSAGKLPQTITHINALNVPTEIPWELIIVDNASTDETYRTALDLTKNADYDHFVVSENLIGLKNARLKGVAESKYEFISFIDDDNWICPQWVEVVYDIMSYKPDIGACGGVSEPAFDAAPPLWFESVQEGFAVGKQCDETGYVPDSRGYLWGAGLTVRRTAFNNLLARGFDFLLCGREGNELSSGEDSELCFALRLTGWKLWYDERIKFFHYMPDGRLNLDYLNKLYWAHGHSAIILSYYNYFLQHPSNNLSNFFDNFLSFAIASYTKSTSYLIENLEKIKSSQNSNPDVKKIALLEYELGKAMSNRNNLNNINKYFDAINRLNSCPTAENKYCSKSTSQVAVKQNNVSQLQYHKVGEKIMALDRNHWIETMKSATAGHSPEAASAVDASIGEANELFNNRVAYDGCRILDVGSGNGRSAIGLMQFDIDEYVGIDIMKSCVDFCHRAFEQYPNYKFIWMDIRNDDSNPQGTFEASEFRFPFEDGYFDSVIAGSLFTHLSTPEICAHYLSEMNRVLNKNGRLFSSWFRSPPNEVSSSPFRTVLPESTIINMICSHFEIYHTRGGIAPGYNDQWCIFSKKVPK